MRTNVKAVNRHVQAPVMYSGGRPRQTHDAAFHPQVSGCSRSTKLQLLRQCPQLRGVHANVVIGGTTSADWKKNTKTSSGGPPGKLRLFGNVKGNKLKAKICIKNVICFQEGLVLQLNKCCVTFIKH